MTTLTVNKKKHDVFFENTQYFQIFLYLLHALRYILTYLDSTENMVMLFCHCFHNH